VKTLVPDSVVGQCQIQEDSTAHSFCCWMPVQCSV